MLGNILVKKKDGLLSLFSKILSLTHNEPRQHHIHRTETSDELRNGYTRDIQ